MYELVLIANLLIQPMAWILFFSIILFVISIKRRSSKKICLFLFLQMMFTALISTRHIPYALISQLESQYPALLETPQEITTVVVLGGGTNTRPTLPKSGQLAPKTLIRLNEGISHFNNLDSARLIVTGGAIGSSIPIAADMREMAIALGVDSSHIAMADLAMDTEMEAAMVREMVEEDSMILVTSAKHMPRAAALFREQGFDPIEAPTEFRAIFSLNSIHAFMPSSENVFIARIAVKEHTNMIWAKISGKI